MTDTQPTVETTEPEKPKERAAHYRGNCEDMAGQTIQVEAGRFLKAVSATYDLERDRTRVVFERTADPSRPEVKWFDEDFNEVDPPDGDVSVRSESVRKPLHSPEQVLAEMGSIVELIEASGTVKAENLDRLHQLGLPIRAWLIKDLGLVNVETLNQMVTAGLVDAQAFLAAIENNIHGPDEGGRV
ncbi:hypothetical protein E4P29_18640 [Rhodococcus sp. 1R11]|uniref:hypothetical protein n=1 Tax=Rhodococcus sp. 1R11 TaxID=2559614 RepID=UPI001072DA38|nr:hypothetical protein [Rhodococcus sp. 1R11]TFI42068.1 hypothetical protein E4P29_18640 [Rhodococcus sp. 1R11]